MNEGREARLREVLESYFLAEESGHRAELEDLCGDDEALLVQARAVLEKAQRIPLTAPRATELEAAPDLPFTRLGEFRLIEPLATGGMGTVYLAEQVPLGRHVALKVLHSSVWHDPTARLRFQREAEIAAALDHPNIVPIHAVGEDRGLAYLAMKCLSGPSLAEIEKPLDAAEVAFIGCSVARALAAAHASGIVHRDVKPANILLDDGKPCIVDFGLARGVGEPRLTRPQVVAGTLPYVAPEQLESGEFLLSPQIDVYALGATLYELLSGGPPFAAKSSSELMRHILLRDAAPLRLPRAQRDLEVIVLRALEKDPARRFPTAAAMAEDLERYLESKPIRSRRTGPLGRLTRRARRHPRQAAAVGVAGVVLVGLLALLASAWRSEARSTASELLRAERLLDERSYRSAGEVLRHLGERGGNRARALLDRAEAGWLAQSLLTQVLDRREGIDCEELDALAREVELRAPEEHASTTHMALALAAYHLERPDDAGRHLDRLLAGGLGGTAVDALGVLLGHERAIAARPAGRAVEASARLAGDTEPEIEDEERALEHVVAATALRLAGADFDDVVAHVDRAVELAPSSPWVRFTRAVTLTAQGRQRDAELVLEGLVGTWSPRPVSRLLARTRMRLGDLSGARAALRRVPVAEWTGVEAYMDLDLLSREGDETLLAARLDRHLGTWPRAAEMVRARAEFQGLTEDRVADSIAALEALAKSDTDLLNRDLAAASVLRIRLAELERRGSAGDAPDGATEAAELAEEALARLEELTWPEARGMALWTAGRALVLSGDARASLSTLRRAMDMLRGHAGPRLDFAVAVRRVLIQDPPAPEETSHLRREALSTLRELFDDIEQGELGPLSDEDEVRALDALFVLAAAEHDARALVRFVPRYLEIEHDARRRAKLEEFLAWARNALEAAFAER